MSPIPDELIEQVRDAADMVGLIGEHVDLRRTGSDWRGPCPFHGGTHRNFAVIPKKQMFYCFVCHEGGDIFTYYMKKVGMEYPTAVREVAAKSGITIPERPSAGPDPREPLFTAVAAAADWYARRLREADDAKRARDYLAGRGFDLEQLAPLGLGYAPRGDSFLTAMDGLGIAADVLVEAGLAARREDGSLRPRFWSRLLFPIRDLRGRPVGFGGRALDDEAEPKYLNSPDSPVFHKGALLYNLHDAKHAIRKAERAVLVEGYFDVLRLMDVGVEEVVAPLGTSFTAPQAALIKRFAPAVILCYDSDAAGLRASFRAADVLLAAGLRVAVATPPPGEDPDTLARAGGAAAVAQVLDDALDVLERKLQLLERKGWLGSLSGRRRALDRLLPTLRAAADPVTRDLYVGRVAEALGVSRDAVLQELGDHRPAAPPRPPSPAPARRSSSGPERDLLRVMVHEPDLRSRVVQQLGALTLRREPERSVLEAWCAQPELAPGELLGRLEGEARTLLTEIMAEPWSGAHADAYLAGALSKLESEPLKARVRAIDRAIALASGDEKERLFLEKRSLSERIRALDRSNWNVITRGRTRAS